MAGGQLVGTVLADRYRILNLIGDGGMGRVFAAEHVTLRRKIAIKVLRDELSRAEANVERFLQEAQAASMISHTNVVDILDFGRTPSGSVFFAMEYLEGEDLAALLRRERRLSWPQVQNIVLQVARGLGAAHEHGVIHRDMKPANIFLVRRPDGTAEVKLVDFGIAKVLGHDGRAGLTGQGSVFGTARYMSPEQASGLAVDARSDIYAVGILLYEMLTGTVPFPSDNFMRVASQHINDPIERPRDAEPAADISDAVEALILRALEKDPKKRYPSMAEFEAAILACAFDSTVAIQNPLLEDGIDQTIIYDAERGQKLRELKSTKPRVPAVRVDPAVDATIVKPRPSRDEPLPKSTPGPRRSSPSRSRGPSWRPLTGAGPGTGSSSSPGGASRSASGITGQTLSGPTEEPSISDAPPMLDQMPEMPPLQHTPPPVNRAGDGAFFAPSAASHEDGMPSAALLPRGMDRPAPIFAKTGSEGSSGGGGGLGEPSAHRTLPPVNWVGGNPNPSTYENHLSRDQGAETAEFGLNIPRQQVSRNWLVVVVAAVALIVVSGGVAAWLLIFQDDNSVDEAVHPTVVADEPRPQVVPREPVVPEPPEPTPEPEPQAEPEQPPPVEATPAPRKKRRSTRRSAPKSVDTLSDKDISRGFAKARSAIVACGNKHGALSGASFRVTFDVSGGKASNVSIQRPQNVTPLGKCVKSAVENSTRFPKSNQPSNGITRSVKF